MTYVPQDLRDLVPPIPAAPSSGGWWGVLVNHNDMFQTYQPTVAQYAAKPFATTATGVDQDLYRFRSANGADYAVGGSGLQLRVDLFARRTNGAAAAGVVRLRGGAATVSANVTATTLTQVTLTADPAQADEEWFLVAQAASTDTVEIAAWVAYWVPTAPGTRLYPSGFRAAGSYWVASNRAVPTELAARVLNGPVLVAQDRPVCVFSHIWRYNTDGSSYGKTSATAAWGLDNSTEYTRVGYGRVPGCDLRSRRFVVEYYLRASSGSIKGYLTVGAQTHEVTANADGSFELELGPADVDIVAHIDAVGTGWAYFERVQVWRQAT